ncbi:MAG: hypothetical protein AAFY88_16545, partial [Acidobacteriota bacterium]
MTDTLHVPDDAPKAGRVLIFLVGFFALMVGGLFLLPTPSAESQSAGGADGGVDSTFAITDVRAFDGEQMLDGVDVVVSDGRIAAIGPGLEIPADATRLDGAGKTLLPGLIDAHVHSWGTARQDAVRFGVTSMLDQ